MLSQLSFTKEYGLVLYGGTALALRIGHRQSVDFDFFGSENLDKAGLHRNLDQIGSYDVLQDTPNTLTVASNVGDGTVKASFFGDIDFGRVGEPALIDDEHVEVASLADIFGTKLATVSQRVEVKDYIDIAALLKAGESLERGLAAAQALYRKQFNPAIALRTVCYFHGAGFDQLKQSDRELLTEAASKVREVPHIQVRSKKLSGDH